MNISLTDVEIEMLREAMDAVAGGSEFNNLMNSQSSRAKRIGRKLDRAMDHSETKFE